MHMLHFRRFAICLHNSQYHFNLTETKKKDSFTHDFFIWCQSPLLRDSYKAVTLHSHILPVMVTKLSHSIHTFCQSLLQSCHTSFTHSASPCYKAVTLYSHTLPVLVTTLKHSIHTLCQSWLQSPCYRAVSPNTHCQSWLQSPCYNTATLHSHTLSVLVTKSLLQSCDASFTHSPNTHSASPCSPLFSQSTRGQVMAFYHWGHWPPGSTWWPAQSPCWPQPRGQSAWAAHWWWGVEGSGAGPQSAEPCSVTGASGPPGTRTAHWGTSATISQEINLGSGRSAAIRQ